VGNLDINADYPVQNTGNTKPAGMVVVMLPLKRLKSTAVTGRVLLKTIPAL